MVSLLVLAALYLVLVLVYALASLILLGLPSQADAQAMYGVDAGRSVLNAFRPPAGADGRGAPSGEGRAHACPLLTDI